MGRQDYIFGGTDNRNVNIKLDALGDLKKWDIVYMFDTRMVIGRPRAFIVKKVGKWFGNDDMLLDLNRWGSEQIRKGDMNETCAMSYNNVLVSTDESCLLEVVNKMYSKSFNVEDIDRSFVELSYVDL